MSDSDPWGILVPIIIFAGFGIVSFFVFWPLTFWRLRGQWKYNDAPAIAGRLRKRDRRTLVWSFIALIILLVLELFFDGVHQFVVNLQNAIGDKTGVVRQPWWIIDALVGGASLGFYLGILMGVWAGMLSGAVLACSREVRCRNLGVLDVA